MAAVRAPLSDGPNPLRAAANSILDSATATLGAGATADATRTIHEFRVAMKRWRAFLRLIEPFTADEARALRREASLLTRELGASRDAQAAGDAFADIAQAATKAATRAAAGIAGNGVGHNGNGAELLPDAGAATHRLSDRTRKSVDDRLSTLRGSAESSALDRAARKRLTEAMARARAAADRWPLEAVAFPDIAERLAWSYRRARRRLPDEWREASDDDLHELRKTVVALRYQIEIVEPLWPKMWRTFASELQKLRAQLGKANDLAVLGALTVPHGPLARWRRPIAEHSATRRLRHVARAERLAGRLFSETPRAFRRRLLALWRAERAHAPEA